MTAPVYSDWPPNGLSGLDYQGQLRKQEIESIAGKLIRSRVALTPRQFQGASFDLTIGAIYVREGNHVTAIVWSPTGDPDATIELQPGAVAIVVTREELCIPLNIVASSLPVLSRAGEGILVLSHGHVDPGFRGHLMVRLLSIRKNEYPLRIGARILTMTFEQIAQPAPPYPHQPKSFEDVCDDARIAVGDTAPAAVLDIEGAGIKRLVSEEFRRLQRMARKRQAALVGAAGAIGGTVVGLIVKVIDNWPAIVHFLAHVFSGNGQ